MVVFLSATVNPSGLTTALAALLWASGITVLAPSLSGPTSISYPILLVSATLFPWLRRDAVLFEGIILISLIALARRSDWAQLARQRWIQATALATTASATVVVFGWSASAASQFAEGAPDAPGVNLGGLRDLYNYVLGTVGWFGWLDTPLPNPIYAIALVVLGSMLIVALSASSAPFVRSILVSLSLILALPVAVGVIRYPYFQGRYMLPLTIGLFFVAGAGLTESHLPKQFSSRMVAIVLSIWGTVQLVAFVQNLRRYAVGIDGGWNLIENAAWSPPLFGNIEAILFAIGSIIVGAVSLWRLNSNDDLSAFGRDELRQIGADLAAIGSTFDESAVLPHGAESSVGFDELGIVE